MDPATPQSSAVVLDVQAGADRRRVVRVAQLVATLWLLSLADLFFTLWAHRFTDFNELNPLARALLDSRSLHMLVAMKLGLTALGSAIFWHLRRYARAEAALWALLGVYVLLAVRWSEYTVAAMAVGLP